MIFGVFLVALGALNVAGAVQSWSWFVNWPSNRWFYGFFGHRLARSFHVLVGVGAMVLGLAGIAGIVDFART